MSIPFNCGCGRHFEVTDVLAGKRAKCHGCGVMMTIPTPARNRGASVAGSARGHGATGKRTNHRGHCPPCEWRSRSAGSCS